MAHGALGNVSERKKVYLFFPTCFFLSNSFLFCAGGLLWLRWEHSKDISFQHNALSSRERGVLYRMLKNQQQEGKKVRLVPQLWNGGMESWPGKGCSADLTGPMVLQ